MDDQRMTTTERPCHRVPELGGECAEYLRGRHDERVRVVEGLVATIKAIGANYDQFRYGGGPYSYRGAIDDVLAVVEAAREDTT